MKPHTLASFVVGALVAAAAATPRLRAHESPVDPVTRIIWIWVENERLYLRHEVRVSERAALLELRAMDRNRDATIQEDEQLAFLAAKAKLIASRWQVRVGDVVLPLEPTGPVRLTRGWQQTCEFHVALAALPAGTHVLRWREDDARLPPGSRQLIVSRPPELAAPAPAAGSRPARLRVLPGRAAAPTNLVELELVF